MDYSKCYACEKIEFFNSGTYSMPKGWNILFLQGVPLLFCADCSTHFEIRSYLDNPIYISDYMKEILANKNGHLIEVE